MHEEWHLMIHTIFHRNVLSNLEADKCVRAHTRSLYSLSVKVAKC
jgi:hypothetical protein